MLICFLCSSLVAFRSDHGCITITVRRKEELLGVEWKCKNCDLDMAQAPEIHHISYQFSKWFSLLSYYMSDQSDHFSLSVECTHAWLMVDRMTPNTHTHSCMNNGMCLCLLMSHQNEWYEHQVPNCVNVVRTLLLLFRSSACASHITCFSRQWSARAWVSCTSFQYEYN